MSKLSLGIVETVGLAAGIEAADAAVKSANVELLGYELTKGGGMVTIKLVGDVGAVKAAVDAACVAASKISSVYSQKVIARPHEEIEKLIYSKETVGLKQKEAKESEKPQKKETNDDEMKEDIIEIETEEVEESPSESEEVNEIEEIEAVEETEEIEEEVEEVEDTKEIEEDNTEIQVNTEDIVEDKEDETTEEDSDVEKKNKEIENEPVLEHEEVLKIEKTPEELCNYCKDPECPRKKGELRSTCIHYDQL